MQSKTGKIVLSFLAIFLMLIIVVVALNIVFNMNNTLGNYSYGGTSQYSNSDMYSNSFSSSLKASESSNTFDTASKVITRNSISIETKNINRSVASLEKLITSYGGKIISKNVDLGDSRYGSISAKIPSNKGSEFVDKVNKDYNVSSYSTDVSDVTETYVNTDKEIQNLQKKIALYNKLANQTPIKEIDTRIQIVDKISDLQNQIDYLKEQNKSINKAVEYRDVTISLSAPNKIQGEHNYWRNTLQIIVLTLQGSLRVVIVLITLAIPFAIIIGIIVAFYIHGKRNKIKRG